nr:hypothetical protein [uncultured Psychroserpens sp.]
MMKKLICVVILLMVGATSFGQKLKCKKFKTGTFIIPGDANIPQSTLKRNKTSQFESISATEFLDLDITWVDDCNYVLTIKKDTPEEDISEVEKLIEEGGGLRIEMLKTVKDTMYFRAIATIKGTDYPTEGKQIKISKKY